MTQWENATFWNFVLYIYKIIIMQYIKVYVKYKIYYI